MTTETKKSKAKKKAEETDTVSTASAITQPTVDETIVNPLTDLLETEDEKKQDEEVKVLVVEEEKPVVTAGALAEEAEALSFDDLPRVVELSVDELAKILHDSTKVSVETGSTVDAVHFGSQIRRFVPWEILKEGAKEGYRTQAKFLFATLGN